MSMSNQEVIRKFAGGSTHGKSAHIFIEGDVLYDYGYHFPLLVRIHTGADTWYLMNADKYSVTTSKHQGYAARHAKVLIPFSVLYRILGENISRQGFLSAVSEMKIIDKEKEVYEPRSYINKDGEKVEYTERRPDAVVFELKEKHYLSSMDNGNYFATELPYPVKTVKDAFADLIPDAVKGKEYQRQGEWFFIPSSLFNSGEKVAITKGTKKEKRTLWDNKTVNHIVPVQFLQNKNANQIPHHYATEYGHTDGQNFPLVRGMVKHSQGDHKVLKLGKIWHVAVESNHVQSFGASGRVD